MKRLLTLILGIAVTLGSLLTVQAKRRDAIGYGTVCGKVSQIDRKAKTFTLTAKGKKYKFFSFDSGVDLKVGEVVDVTYTGTLGGSEPAKATTVKSSKSNTPD
jgi:hypothetical protein